MSAPFMQLYVADYLGDTRHLTTEQHGAYLLLLMTMWRADGRLPNDPKKLARIAGCTASRWAKISDEVMAFFTVECGEIVNKRLAFELAKAREKSIKRADAGTKGGNAKAFKNNESGLANASRLPEHSSEPEPERRREANASLLSEGFERFWSAYPSKVGKRDAEKAFAKAVKRIDSPDPPGVMLAAIQRAAQGRRWLEGYIPNPATWLNQDRWEDQPDERPDHQRQRPTDARRADTESRRNAWAEVLAERDGLQPEPDGGGSPRSDGDGARYLRLAHTG